MDLLRRLAGHGQHHQHQQHQQQQQHQDQLDLSWLQQQQHLHQQNHPGIEQEDPNSFDQHGRSSPTGQWHERYKRSSWPATAVLQRPAPPPPFLHWFDRQLLAAVVSILLLCWLSIATDYGPSPQLPTTTAHLASPASSSYHSIAVHSTVLDINLEGEVLLVEFRVQHRGPEVAAACSSAKSGSLQLAVGTAEPPGARPAAVIPLCPHSADATHPATALAVPAGGDAGRGEFAVYRVPLPMRQTNMLASPWEELAADIKMQLWCAGGSCTARDTPGVTWTAHWASSKMQLEVERHMLQEAVPLLDAAGAYPISEASTSTLEALGLHWPLPEAAFSVQMRRHPGNRSLQLLVAVVQLGFILYCLLMGAGQVLWAYVVARFLCVRTHMTRRSTSAG